MRLPLNNMICDFIPLLLLDNSNFCCDNRNYARAEKRQYNEIEIIKALKTK